MAERRILSARIIMSDAFRALPPKVQLIYIHLYFEADDDGFVGNALAVCKQFSAKRKVLEQLEELGYIIIIDDVVIITHWLVVNKLRNTRTKPLTYPDIAVKVWVAPDKRYTLLPPTGSIRLPDRKQPASAAVDADQPQEDEEHVIQDRQLESLFYSYPHERRGPRKEAIAAMREVIRTWEDLELATRSLHAWMDCDQWQRGMIPNLSKWIDRGYWASPPVSSAAPQVATNDSELLH